MPRAVVLPELAQAARGAPVSDGQEREAYGSGPAGEADSGSGLPSPDAYGERLVKYIPGEALAAFLPLSTFVSSDVLLVALLAGCTVGAGLWAVNRNADLKPELRQPAGRVAGFAVVAFLAWAGGTSQGTQELIGLPPQAGAVVLTVVALILPAIDRLLARRRQGPGNSAAHPG